MTETRIMLTDRLRREGREEEAVRYRNQVREQLKAEGKTRKEAMEGAWEATRLAFTPLPSSEKSTLTATTVALASDVDDAVADEDWVIRSFSPLFAVAELQAKHHVNLTDEALKELLGRLLGFGFAWAWLMGARGDRPPGADCSTGDSLARVAALIERTFEKMAEAITPEDLATFTLPNSGGCDTMPA